MHYQPAKASFARAALLVAFTGIPLSATVVVGLSHPNGTSQPVGTPVHWTATNAANDGKTLQFKWVITQNGSTVVFRDFNTTATISYAPLQEGAYTVTVTGRDAAHITDTDTVSASYSASSLLKPSGAPNVAATQNPLVAIYTAACASGTMRVFFAPVGTAITSGFATPPQRCVSGRSANFIIAGMRANTTYNLIHQIQSGFSFSGGPMLQFTTGSIPSSVPLPSMTVGGSTTTEPVILESEVIPNELPVAFDSSGHVIWYNYPAAPGGINFLFRPLNGGTMLLGAGDILQQIDLLGNILRETNIIRMSEQLTGPPFNIINSSIPNRLADFDHDAIRLPNGDTAVICYIEQIANQGQGPVDVLGNLILVLDQNFQLVWAWDSFAHLNVMRKATLNDVCAQFQVGCPALKFVPPGTPANDWLHGNSLAYTGDGDLFFSMRDQDWVIKIDYANGTGTGNVLWRFGNQGDFTLSGGQWFSHQHNATLSGTTLYLFDNANADSNLFGGSRGLVFTINEQTKMADIITEAFMGTFSPVLGTAQNLLNGNWWFLSGLPATNTSHAIEFTHGSALASPVFHADTNSNNYRSFRMKDLYTP